MADLPILTDKQHRVARWLVLGLTQEEIAERMDCHVNTIRYHIKRLQHHLKVDKARLIANRYRELFPESEVK